MAKLEERDPARYVACQQVSGANVNLISVKNSLNRTLNLQPHGFTDGEARRLMAHIDRLESIQNDLSHMAHTMRHS